MKSVLALFPLLTLMACSADDDYVRPRGVNMDYSSTGEMGGAGGFGSASSSSGGTACECAFGNGSRLSRNYIIGDDVSRMETPFWHDGILGLDCEFRYMSDKQTYCVPPMPSTPNKAYIDAACTKPVLVEVYVSGDPLSMCVINAYEGYRRVDELWNTPDPCDGNVSGFSVYKVDTNDVIHHNSDTVVWYEGSPGSCYQQGPLQGTGAKATIFGMDLIGDETAFVKSVAP